jgi:preprotein translocase subunit SecE
MVLLYRQINVHSIVVVVVVIIIIIIIIISADGLS